MTNSSGDSALSTRAAMDSHTSYDIEIRQAPKATESLARQFAEYGGAGE
jgi:hypothetical protein